jgi:hypothetical protein
MRVNVTTEAADFISRRGGKLFVRLGPGCCGGTQYVKTSVRPPLDAERYVPITEHGIVVYVGFAENHRPDELDVAMVGRIRPRPRAAWNGCAFAV